LQRRYAVKYKRDKFMGLTKLLSSEQQELFYMEYHKFLLKAKLSKNKYLLHDFFNQLKSKYPTFNNYKEKELSNKIIALRRVEGSEYWPNLNDVKNYISPYASDFLQKSHQSALLAVEIYNKPLVTYKSEGFIVLMMIAWTSLFHSIFTSNGESIRYNDGNYFDLRKCVKKYTGKLKNEIEANMNLLIDIRDKITHRENTTIDEKLFGYCQACLNNYQEILYEHFGQSYSLPTTLAYSLQFSKKHLAIQLEALKDYNKNYNYKILDFIKEYENRLYKNNPDIFSSQSYCYRIYIVPKLVKEKSAEAAVEIIDYDALDNDVAKNIDKAILLIKENRVGGNFFKASEVCKIIREKLKNKKGDDWKFSPSYHHSKVAKYFKIREGYKTNKPEITRKEYCLYEPIFGQYIYSKQWIDFLIKKLKDDNIYSDIFKTA